MPSLSIVIPAVSGIESLESTLVSVLQNRPRDCEIVVVVNQRYTDPYELKGEVQFLEAPGKARFVDCANLGISHTSAPLVHILAAGCEVEENWAQAAVTRLRDSRVASVAPIVLDPEDHERIVAAGVEYGCGGSRILRVGQAKKAARWAGQDVLAACSWAAFYRRGALARVGGLFSPTVGDQFVDVDLGLALEQAGLRTVFEPDSRIYAAAEPLRPQSSFRTGLAAERLFWRNLPARGWWRSLALHPLVVCRQTLLALATLGAPAHMAGRLLACCQMGQYRVRHKLLADLQVTQAPDKQKGRSHLRVDRPHIAGPSFDSQPKRARAG